MAIAAQWTGAGRRVSLEEYLRTSYRPDCDYVDGRVEERNVGEWDHANVQKILLRLLWQNETAWGVVAIQECRLQVRPDRFRVPDGMVLRAEQKVDRVVREAPLACIEVLSPEDTWGRVREVLGDYLAMGVAYVWAVDPQRREAFRFLADGSDQTVSELAIEGIGIRISAKDVFAVLDKEQSPGLRMRGSLWGAAHYL